MSNDLAMFSESIEDGKRHGLYQGKLWTDDPLGKSLDWFIIEWNRQAKELNKKDRKNILSWARGV